VAPLVIRKITLIENIFLEFFPNKTYNCQRIIQKLKTQSKCGELFKKKKL
jgi:hypothetical protein